MRRTISGAAIAAGLALASPSLAQPLPADCSLGEIPDGPLVLRMPGQPERPLQAAKVVRSGTMEFSSDDGEQEVYDTFRLVMSDRAGADIFERVGEVVTSFLVEEGQALGGQKFRKPPARSDTPEYDAQDKLGGQVVFQSWSVQLPRPGDEDGELAVDVDHVFHLASARVEFGKQEAGGLPGKIRLCVPGNQKTPFDAPPNSQIEVAGSFIAALDEPD